MGFQTISIKITGTSLKNLIRMIINVFGKYKVEGFANSSFLSLDPKESSEKTFRKFRPISLCNSHEIITNILANGIKVMLP